jgi:hypothetical protein
MVLNPSIDKNSLDLFDGAQGERINASISGEGAPFDAKTQSDGTRTSTKPC